MRISDVLGMEHDSNDHQVEGFLGKSPMKPGTSRKIKAGKVGRNYYCPHCRSNRTFTSIEELTCLFENEHLVSIDTVLSCPTCPPNAPTNVEAWFLIGCRDTVLSASPTVYLLQCSERLTGGICYPRESRKEFADLLEKADRAYSNQLGAGAVIYLRKIFEKVTFQTATACGIKITNQKNKRIPFRNTLEKVNKQHPIIPEEFSRNGYRLFGDLSDVIHGDFDENVALTKYESFRRLVCGVLDNISNSKELSQAVTRLGWDDNKVAHISGGPGNYA